MDGTAIVITTHYIEETKLAHRVTSIYINRHKFSNALICAILQIGLMRSGKLLAETAPSQLLIRFKCQSLEEAFLNLSKQQEEQRIKGITEIVHEYLPSSELKAAGSITSLNADLHGSAEAIIKNGKKNGFSKSNESDRKFKKSLGVTAKTYQALLSKNFFQFVRHPGFVYGNLKIPNF